MKQETKNTFAAILADAQAKTAEQGQPIKPAEASPVTSQETEPAQPETKPDEVQYTGKPVKMVSFVICWSETDLDHHNTPFPTWKAANKEFTRIAKRHEGMGYTKVKVNIKWEDGSEITDRVDVSQNNGDFWPSRETLGQFLQKFSSTMYGSNLEKGTRRKLQWEDEDTAPAQIAPVPEPETKHPENKANTLQIVDYSDKAFAVIGETKPVKDQLKALGGRFNMFLKCGAGWIFSKKHLPTVKTALSL